MRASLDAYARNISSQNCNQDPAENSPEAISVYGRKDLQPVHCRLYFKVLVDTYEPGIVTRVCLQSRLQVD